MKKTVLILIAGLMLVGVNAFGAGDLIVNGKVGVGTVSPLYKLDIDQSNAGSFRSVSNYSTLTNLNNYSSAFNLFVSDTSGYTDKIVTGFTSGLIYDGLANQGVVTNITGYQSNILLNTAAAGTHGFNDITNAEFRFTIGTLNNQNVNVDTYYGFRHFYNDSGGGTITGNNWYGAHFANPNSADFQPSNLYGLYLEKQSRGINNYGIVLAGDESGADIVFGTGNNVRLYSRAGDLYVKDAASNETLLGPHDPETGEWIFYSKNSKTGKIVRVEMEKLVKAVEKLTGETFMVESLIDK